MASDMKRVAQLGNSHAQAIAEALVGFPSDRATISSFPMFHDWRVAASAGAAPAIVIEPLNKANVTIVLDAFDLYVISAAGWWACRNEHLTELGKHPLAFVRCTHWGAPTSALPQSIQIVSRAAFEDMIYTWVAGHRIPQLVRFLALETDKKVIWVSWPVPSRSLLTNREWLLNVWYGDRMPQVWREFRAAEQRAVLRLATEYGNNVTLLPTPRSEMEEEGFMDEALAAPDPFHGNVKYGALVVEQLAPLIG